MSSLTTTSRVVIAVSKAESATSQLVGQVVEHEHFLTQINGGLFFGTVWSLFKILTRCGCLGRDAFRASVGANFCRFGIRDSFGLQFFARVRLRTSAGLVPYIAVFFWFCSRRICCKILWSTCDNACFQIIRMYQYLQTMANVALLIDWPRVQ